jgi:hypothetical protein
LLRRALRAFLDAPHLLLLLWASLLTLHLLHLALELSLHVLLLLDMLALHLVHPRLLLPLQLCKIRTGVLRLRCHDVLQIAGGTSFGLRAPALRKLSRLALLLAFRSCFLLSLLLHLPRLLLLLLHLLLHLLHLHLLLLLHLHRLHLHSLLHLLLHSLLLLRWRHLLLRWWHLLLRRRCL